jgi:hypothetical protein
MGREDRRRLAVELLELSHALPKSTGAEYSVPTTSRQQAAALVGSFVSDGAVLFMSSTPSNEVAWGIMLAGSWG